MQHHLTSLSQHKWKKYSQQILTTEYHNIHLWAPFYCRLIAHKNPTLYVYICGVNKWISLLVYVCMYFSLCISFDLFQYCAIVNTVHIHSRIHNSLHTHTDKPNTTEWISKRQILYLSKNRESVIPLLYKYIYWWALAKANITHWLWMN